MLLIRPAFWSALPPFSPVFGRNCSQAVPTFRAATAIERRRTHLPCDSL